VKTTDGIETIRDDKLSGAQSITNRAASMVEKHLRSVMPTFVDVKRELLDLGPALINAQPAMAPLFNLFNTLLHKLDACRDRPEIPSILREQVRELSRAMDDHNRAIAEQVNSTIPDGAAVFTHSDSSTLRAALQHSHRTGKQFSVFCTESRPACEGRRLAQALVETGISTCLVTDSLIFSLLREDQASSILLVGADSIGVKGVINKAGTAGLGVATRSWGVPFYVLAGSEKFLPAGFFPRADQEKPPEEILSQPPAGLRIINRYFDITPLDCITAVISEEGRLSSGDLSAKLEQLQAHPDLLAALAQNTTTRPHDNKTT